MALFSSKTAAPAASDLRRERRALLLLREDRLRELGGLTLEMYRRDHFNETLIVERCAELVAIEARASEIEALLQGARGLRRRGAAICACGAPVLMGARFCPSCGRSLIDDASGAGGGRVTSCPRCGGGVATGQEYCLECGVRLPGKARLGPAPSDPRTLALPLVIAAVIAVAGAAVAIALTRETATATPIVTATGGSEVVRTPTVADVTRLAQWPEGTSGWTNILVSVPKVNGRDAAVARADQARKKGLRDVGVLDSSLYASLHPGYWMVFAGVYPSEPEASSRLREARTVQKGARTEHVSR